MPTRIEPVGIDGAPQAPVLPATDDILKDDVNFLKIGKDVYALTKTNATIVQAVDHVREHYRQRVERTLADVQREAFGVADVESDREFQRVVAETRRGQVNVPNDRHEQLVTVLNGRLCPVRAVQFYITAMRGRADRFHGDESIALSAKFPGFADEFATKLRTHDLIVTFTESPGATICYALEAGRVGVNRRVYHAFDERMVRSQGWWKLCTGNASADQFWNAAGFADSVRILNLDSPATRVMRFDVPNRDYTTSELILQFDCAYAFVAIDQNGAAEGWQTTRGGAR